MDGIDQQLDRVDRVIQTLEELMQQQCLLTQVRKLERNLVNLREVRRSMQRLDKTDPKGRKKFWQLSRRFVSLASRMAKRLSSS